AFRRGDRSRCRRRFDGARGWHHSARPALRADSRPCGRRLAVRAACFSAARPTRRSTARSSSDAGLIRRHGAWTSQSADDGHVAQGFYTFVVNGGPVGILSGTAESEAPAADLMVALTVTE